MHAKIKLNMKEDKQKLGLKDNYTEKDHHPLYAGLNICIDLDGTVTEPYYWLRRANAYFGKHLRPQDINSYAIYPLLGVDAASYQKFHDTYGELMHLESRIRQDADFIIRRLFQNHQIHFVSAREEKMLQVSIEWLNKYHIPMDSIHLLGMPDKVEKARELNCHVFIEDSSSNAIQLANGGFQVLLINCSYNQGLMPENVTRVDSWKQIFNMIEKRYVSGNSTGQYYTVNQRLIPESNSLVV
jgi:uncharacterized protein